MVPCGRLSWLYVSFWVHVNIVYGIVQNNDRKSKRVGGRIHRSVIEMSLRPKNLGRHCLENWAINIQPRLLLNVNRKSYAAYHLPWSSVSPNYRKRPKWPSAGDIVSPSTIRAIDKPTACYVSYNVEVTAVGCPSSRCTMQNLCVSAARSSVRIFKVNRSDC